MLTDVVASRIDQLTLENARLRELLKRWVRQEWEPVSGAELMRLRDDTKRALLRLGPGWVVDEDD